MTNMQELSKKLHALLLHSPFIWPAKNFILVLNNYVLFHSVSHKYVLVLLSSIHTPLFYSGVCIFLLIEVLTNPFFEQTTKNPIISSFTTQKKILLFQNFSFW